MRYHRVVPRGWFVLHLCTGTYMSVQADWRLRYRAGLRLQGGWHLRYWAGLRLQGELTSALSSGLRLQGDWHLRY